MKKYFITSLFLLTGLIAFSQTGNVGIGNTTPVAKLDVAGDLALREGSAIAVSGADPAVSLSLDATASENSFYRITGSPTGTITLTNIINNGVDGQIITLVNATTINLKITNNNTAYGILTAGGSTQNIIPKGSITLQYSKAALRWYLTNTTGSTLADWIKATTVDQPAINTDNQYVTGNVGLGGHVNGTDKTYDFATNNPLVPLVVVSPGAATAASSPVSTGLRLAQPGTNGTKWPLSADFNLGSYATSGVNAQSQLNIALGNGGTSTPDATVMSILGNGSVGIGTVSPKANLHVVAPAATTAFAARFTQTNVANGNNMFIGLGTENAAWSKGAIVFQRTNSYDVGDITFNLNSNAASGTDVSTTDERMRISSNGNIYVGNPNATSDVYLYPKNPIGGSNPTYLRIGSSSNPMQDLYSNNAYISKVVIGSTSASTNYPLRVDSKANADASYRYYYYNNPDGSNGTSTSVAANVSMYTAGRILVNGEVDVISDKRIKNVIGLSNNDQDLTTLNKIQITDYTMKEDLTANPHVFKKVIAQQVKSVYPNAVRVEKEPFYVPNIFQRSNSAIWKGSNLTITIDKSIEKDKDIDLAHNIKCYVFEKGNQNKIEILGQINTIKDNSIEITIANIEAIKNKEIMPDVFVYGTEVNDFLDVDYDALGMLNISATQELYKKITALEKENSDLKTQTQTTIKDVSQLKAQLEDSTTKNEKDVAELKAQIDELKKLIFNTGLNAEK